MAKTFPTAPVADIEQPTVAPTPEVTASASEAGKPAQPSKRGLVDFTQIDESAYGTASDQLHFIAVVGNNAKPTNCVIGQEPTGEKKPDVDKDGNEVRITKDGQLVRLDKKGRPYIKNPETNKPEAVEQAIYDKAKVHMKDVTKPIVEKRPDMVGARFTWHGETPLEVFDDYYTGKGNRDMAMQQGLPVPVRTIQPGETFDLTLASANELVGRVEFDGKVFAPAIAKDTDGAISYVIPLRRVDKTGTRVVNGKEVAVKSTDLSDMTLSLQTLRSVNPNSTERPSKPLRDYIVHMFSDVDAKGFRTENSQLLPEFTEKFGKVAEVSSRGLGVGKAKAAKHNVEAIELSALLSQMQRMAHNQ